MIPTSYFSKTLYQERWGDPRNPHAVDLPQHPAPRHGDPLFSVITLASTLRQRLTHRPVYGAEQPCT